MKKRTEFPVKVIENRTMIQPTLRLLRTGFPFGAKRVVRDVWQRVGGWSKLPLGRQRISGNTDVSFRFPDEKSLEITDYHGKTFAWKRVQ